MDGHRPSDRPRHGGSALRRVESEFLRPHRAGMMAALGLMLVQSLLALPVPLLPGWPSIAWSRSGVPTASARRPTRAGGPG